MNVNFDNTQNPSNPAIFCGRVNQIGTLLAWCGGNAGGFWIGRSQNVGTPWAPQPGVELRDGFYIEASAGPIALPWQGEVWAVNGTGAGDQPQQWGTVELMECRQ